MTGPAEALIATILFIPLSAAEFNLEADWAEAGMQVILRHCPICSQDSIVGHGRRRKQAHDQRHDWIGIRRGLCSRCGKTFTFLPPFSPPYGHYPKKSGLTAVGHAILNPTGAGATLVVRGKARTTASSIRRHRSRGFNCSAIDRM